VRPSLGLDVLVEVEEVLGVVRPLDLDEAFVIAFVVGPDPILVVCGHEVDVTALLRQRRCGGVIVPHPRDVGLVVVGVGPYADDDCGKRRIAIRERRRIRRDAMACTVDRVDVGRRVDGGNLRTVLEVRLDRQTA
jgi:hypothetical protein